MAEPFDESMAQRMERLERQMQATLTLLERLEKRMEATGPPEPAPVTPKAPPVQPPVTPPVTEVPEPIAKVQPVEPVEPPTPPQQPQRPAIIFESAAEPKAATPINVPPRPATPPTPPTPHQPHGESIREPIPPMPFDVPPPHSQKPRPEPAPPEPARREWENILGRQWALWAGTLLVFLAVAFFLAYTWEKLPNYGKLTVGVLCALAMLVGAEFSREKVEKGFSEGLAGGGLAVLYLNAWAATARYHVLSLDMMLPLMILVTVIGVCLAVRYDSISLSALSTIGGFLTPALVPSGGGAGGGSALPFLSYIAVLNAGILAIAILKHWRPITWLSFGATCLLLMGWADSHYDVTMRWGVTAFLSVYFLLFLGAAVFHSLLHGEETEQLDLGLVFADAFMFFGAAYAVTEGALGKFPASLPLGLSLFFFAFTVLCYIKAPNNGGLNKSALGLGLLFLTLAVPIQLRQGWIAVGWSLEAAVLILLAYTVGGTLFRRAGQLVWFLAAFTVFLTQLATSADKGPLFLNPRDLPLLAAVLSTALVVFWMRCAPESEPDELLDTYSATAALGGAWLLAETVWLGFSRHIIPWPAAWAGSTFYVIAMVLAVYALALFAAGIQLKDRTARGAALAVATVAAVLPMVSSSIQPDGNWVPFWNPRSLAFIVTVGMLAVLGWMTSREAEDLAPTESDVALHVPTAMHIAILWGVSGEIILAFSRSHLMGWEASAEMTVAAFWCVYAAMLLPLGWASRREEVRWLGYLAAAGGILLLLRNALVTMDMAVTPVSNVRFIAFSVVTAALAYSAWYAGTRSPEEDSLERRAPEAAASAAILVALWGFSQEVYCAFQYFRGSIGVNWGDWAVITIAALWTLYAVMLVPLGWAKGRPEVRWLGYLILCGGALILLGTAASMPSVALRPLLNIRFLAFTIVTAALSFCCWYVGNRTNDPDSPEGGFPSVACTASVFVALWGLTQEIYSGYNLYQRYVGPDWQRLAAETIAATWAVVAAILIPLGWNTRRHELRTLGYLVLFGGTFLALLFTFGWVQAPLPVLNARFLSFAAVVAALAFCAWYIGARQTEPETFDAGVPTVAASAAVLVTIWGLTQETYSTFAFYQEVIGDNWELWAQSAVSLVWTLAATVLLISGIVRNHRLTRISALGIFGITIAKVVILDLSFLKNPYRILSFGGLGIALIGISWMYSKYGVGHEEPPGHHEIPSGPAPTMP